MHEQSFSSVPESDIYFSAVYTDVRSEQALPSADVSGEMR
jgi:hypothetical protein